MLNPPRRHAHPVHMDYAFTIALACLLFHCLPCSNATKIANWNRPSNFVQLALLLQFAFPALTTSESIAFECSSISQCFQSLLLLSPWIPNYSMSGTGSRWLPLQMHDVPTELQHKLDGENLATFKNAWFPPELQRASEYDNWYKEVYVVRQEIMTIGTWRTCLR